MKFGFITFLVLVLSSLNVYAATPNAKTSITADALNAGYAALVAGATIYSASVVVSGGTTGALAPAAGVIIVASATTVTAGYLIGRLAVDVDKTYFRGVIVSSSGRVIGYFSKLIHNVHGNLKSLPAVLKSDDHQTLKVLGTIQ